MGEGGGHGPLQTLSKPRGADYSQHIFAPPSLQIFRPSYGPALLPKECQLVVFVTFVNCQVDVNWQKKGGFLLEACVLTPENRRETRAKLPYKIVEIGDYLKPRTSIMCILSYNSMPESHCDGKYYLLQLLQPIK